MPTHIEEEDEDFDKFPQSTIAYKNVLREATKEHLKQPPRWPVECQVLKVRHRHIFSKLFPLEPFYVPSGKERKPKNTGPNSGSVVYQCMPLKEVTEFSRSDVAGTSNLLPTCPSPEEDGLRFESRFESGNLAKVVKLNSKTYELHLQPDMYTNKHMQWFYFKVTHMKKNISYRLSIVNMAKGVSLYSNGMRPVMYSKTDAKKFIGWRRFGTNISYYCNDDSENSRNSNYTLTFTTIFPHDNDIVFIAHSYPYTYTDLQEFLTNVLNDPVKSMYTAVKLMSKTLAGNNVYEVTITSDPYRRIRNKKKKAIVITARVHPGEAPSSWMMLGIMQFLTSETEAAKELREHFIFKLIPMLNPDGVIVGNNRCSLTGRDLNRQYRSVIRETNPSIWNTRLMIKRLLQENGVAFYCDLHAHSNKNNFFIFGCENRRAVFPLMLQQNAIDKFSIESCEFRVDECKEGTGRVSMFLMGILNSYTLEASFGGTNLKHLGSPVHLNTSDYFRMGVTLCHTILDFFDPVKENVRMKMQCGIARGDIVPHKLSESDKSDNGDKNTKEIRYANNHK